MEMKIRTLASDEWTTLGRFIHASTNAWYQKNLGRDCFPPQNPEACQIFPEVYETLDPGCCLVAEIDGQLAGSCFYHPRETHISLGIMNVAANFSGHGVARALLTEIINIAGEQPLHLVSSALNLDSYSLYTRAGFHPTAIYQDMIFPEIPDIPHPNTRKATFADLPAIIALEEKLTGLRREKDYRHFLENAAGIWHGSVSFRDDQLTGVLFSVNHPASAMLGPGLISNDEDALSLVGAELKNFNTSPLFLAPAHRVEFIAKLYQLGARNGELHFSQVLGDSPPSRGGVMPTFMPE